MTPLPRPTWRDYFLAFVLVTGGIALMTYATAPLIAGGIPALTDFTQHHQEHRGT